MINSHIDLAEIDSKTLHKMVFIYNKIESGWKVKKRDNRYIFQKRHNNKKEFFTEDYLESFIKETKVFSP
jgi:hypothetical protein